MDINETQTQSGPNSVQDILKKLVKEVSDLSIEYSRDCYKLETKLRSSTNWMAMSLEIQENDSRFENELKAKTSKAFESLAPFLIYLT